MTPVFCRERRDRLLHVLLRLRAVGHDPERQRRALLGRLSPPAGLAAELLLVVAAAGRRRPGRTRTSAIADSDDREPACARCSPPRQCTKTVLVSCARTSGGCCGDCGHLLVAAGGGGGAADDELDRERAAAAGVRLAVDQRDRARRRPRRRGRACPGAAWSAAGCTWAASWMSSKPTTERSRGHAQAGLGGGADRAEGHHVRGGEDRRRRLVEREQLGASPARPLSA